MAEVEEKHPYSGFLNHLDSSQEKALTEFKELLISKGLYIPATSTRKASNDDTALISYLRARKFDVQGAYKQWVASAAWRRDKKIDALFDGIDVEQYHEATYVYPQWTGRQDKRGVPLHYYKIAPMDSARMSAYEKSASKTTFLEPTSESLPDDFVPRPKPEGIKDLPKSTFKTTQKQLRLFALYESQTNFVGPLCSMQPRPYTEVEVCQGVTIADVSNVGLKQFWNLGSHMQEVSVLLNAHYPETLDRVYILGAPAFFPTVWGWIKSWFDPATVSKITIVSADEVLPTLEKAIDIENIPEQYGGKLKFDYADRPNLSAEFKDSLIWEEGVEPVLPKGPVRFEDSKDGDGLKELWAIGSENGKRRRYKLAKVRDMTKAKKSAAAEETGGEQQSTKTQAPSSGEHIEEKLSGLDIADNKTPESKQTAAA